MLDFIPMLKLATQNLFILNPLLFLHDFVFCLTLKTGKLYPSIISFSYNIGHILVDICEMWQKVLVRELAKSGYFRSASSESDNK